MGEYAVKGCKKYRSCASAMARPYTDVKLTCNAASELASGLLRFRLTLPDILAVEHTAAAE